MAQDMQDAGNVSAELDAMVCDLIGVVVAIEDSASNRYLAALDEDGE